MLAASLASSILPWWRRRFLLFRSLGIMLQQGLSFDYHTNALFKQRSSAFIYCGCYGANRALQWSVTYCRPICFPGCYTYYCLHYQHGVCLHLSVRSVELMPSYAVHISVAFPKTRLHFKICCMTPEPCCLGKCSPQCIVSTHCCHPKRL